MSLPEDNQQLRKLSRAVMRGEMTRAEYQQNRRRMIDSYTGDTGAADDTDLTDPGMRPAVTAVAAPMPAEPRQIETTAVRAPVQVTNEAADHGDLWIGLVAVIAVMLVIAGALAYFW